MGSDNASHHYPSPECKKKSKNKSKKDAGPPLLGKGIKLFESAGMAHLSVMWNGLKDRKDQPEQYTNDVLDACEIIENWQKQDKQEYDLRFVKHKQTIVACVAEVYQFSLGVLVKDWYEVNSLIQHLTLAPFWNAEHLLFLMRRLSIHGRECTLRGDILEDTRQLQEQVFTDHFNRRVRRDEAH